MDRTNPLYAAMDQTRLELGLSWMELAAKAGVAYETLRQVRRGKPTTVLTERAIARALGWHVQRLRDLRAAVVTPVSPDQLCDDLSRLSPERQRAVRLLVSRLLTLSGNDDHSIGASEITML